MDPGCLRALRQLTKSGRGRARPHRGFHLASQWDGRITSSLKTSQFKRICPTQACTKPVPLRRSRPSAGPRVRCVRGECRVGLGACSVGCLHTVCLRGPPPAAHCGRTGPLHPRHRHRQTPAGSSYPHPQHASGGAGCLTTQHHSWNRNCQHSRPSIHDSSNTKTDGFII